MKAKENLNSLKILVFSMGIVLLGGVALLSVLIWKKTSGDTAGSSISSSDQEVINCAPVHVDLKGHGAVVDSSYDGRNMRVTMEKKEGQTETMLIDICTGKITGTLMLDTDATVVEE